MPDDDEDLEPDEQMTLSAQQYNDLQANARKGRKVDELALEAAAAKRELAFMKAGIPPNLLDGELGKMFAKSYDGELTAEAVIAAATAVGLLEVPASDAPPASTATPDEIAGAGERRDLADGANVPPGNETPNPQVRAVEVARAALDKGATEEDALAAGIATIREAAAAGDPRVLSQAGF
jgi:hypothetical protein